MKRFLVTVALALVTAACAHGTSGTARPPKGHLLLSQQIVGQLYVEGSAGYVTVSDRSGDVYRGTLSKPVTVDLDPGSYTVSSYQRLCIGSCGHLGPPIDRCSASVNVAAGATTAATVELTPTRNSCTIAIPA